MLIFLDNDSYLNEVDLFRKGIREVKLFNLSSMKNITPTLDLLLPRKLCYDIVEQMTFDIEYFNYIMTNNEAFVCFMQLIFPLYYDPNILIAIMIGHDYVRDSITEALIRIIQTRYGYNCFIINSAEDLFFANNNISIPKWGLINLDIDINRLIELGYFDLYLNNED